VTRGEKRQAGNKQTKSAFGTGRLGSRESQSETKWFF
jgi:hypothetical protein